MSAILKSGLLSLMEKGAALVFALGTAMILLRGLSKSDFAAWGVFLIITYFLEMGRSGLIQNGLMTYWAKMPEQRPVLRTSALVLSLFFSVVSNLFLVSGMYWIASTWQVPQIISILPTYFVINMVLAFLYYFNFIQQAASEFRGIFLSTFFLRGSLFLWCLYCWWTGTPLHLFYLSLAFLAGAVLGTVGSWWYARPYLSPLGRLNNDMLSTMIGYGKFVLGTNLSTMFYKNIDKLSLGNLLGPAAFAIYDAAGKITQMVETPSFSIAAAVFPHSAQKMQEEGAQGVKQLYEQSVAAILAIILPFLALVLIFAEPLVLLFAGPEYTDSANILRLTAFFGLFMPFAVQFGTVLDSTHQPHTNFYYTLFTAVLNFMLSYGLVMWLGLFGAAYATLISYLISFVLMQRLLYRQFEIVWYRSFLLLPVVCRKLIAKFKH